MLQLILAIISLIMSAVLIWFCFRLYVQLFPERHMYKRVRQYTRNYLYDKHYHLVENVCVHDSNGNEIVIPQVLVSRFGVFIMGFCPARDRIYGSPSIYWWFSRKGDWYYPFDNPHDQLEPVKKALDSYMKLAKPMSTAMVIFQEQASFNHSDYERTGYLNEIFDQVTDLRLGYLEEKEYRGLISKLEKTQQYITSDVKKGIIETGVIEPTPAS